MRESYERFYGMKLSDDIVGAIDEHLTDQATEDLVEAHLGRNFSYFGAIDKTLAGFVILGDEDDNYTLLDVRDGGQVWWQDHETREVYLETDGLDDYLAWQAAVGEAREASDDWIDPREYHAEFAATEPRSSRAVSSVELLKRYQWLVWACAQPLRRDGEETQSVDDLCRSALGHFRHYWQNPARVDEVFEEEVPELAGDPHLAVYWLLHSMWMMEPERVERVVAEIDDEAPDLVRTFAAAAEGVSPTHDLEIVPRFRGRKSVLLLYEAFSMEGPEQVRTLLRALETDPVEYSYVKAWHTLTPTEAGAFEVDEVADALERIEGDEVGPLLLRVVVDRERDASESNAADELVERIDDEEFSWVWALECLWRAYEFVPPERAVPVAARLEGIDPYHARVAQLVAELAEETGSDELPPVDVAQKRLEDALELKEILTPLFENPEQWLKVIDAIPDHLVVPAAQRMVVWAEVAGEPAVGWALQRLLESDLDHRFELVREGLGQLDSRASSRLLETVADEIDGPEHPGVDFMFEVLQLPDASPNDFRAKMELDNKIEAAVHALAPHVTDPDVFDRLTTFLSTSDRSSARQKIIGELLNPFEEDSYVVSDLDDDQAARVAEALIQLKQSDDVHVSNGAGHQLYRFDHPGAEDVVREALDEYGARYADGADELKDLIANLYASLRSMGTQTSREALVERLFTERRSYWRLGSAFGDIFSDELHALAMSALSERRDADGAAAYTAALRHFVENDQLLAELADEVARWDVPDEPDARAKTTYVLLEGCRSALATKKHELVKTLAARLEEIDETPYSPYHSVDRGSDYENPFESDEDLAAELAAVVSGKAEAKRDELREAAAAARAAGEPNRDIDDDDLGLLASATVVSREFVDAETGELWFRDADGELHYFDGYDVVDPDFEFVPDAAANASEFFGGHEITDRVMFWDVDGNEFVEYVQWGPRLVSYRGINNGAFDSFGVITPSEERADELMRTIRQNPPDGMREYSPYYLDGKGAIVRKYYRPKPDGSYDSDGSQYEAVLDGRFCWQDRRFDSDEEAIAALEQYERETLAEFGGRISCIEWMARLRRAEDLTLDEWLDKRKRNDKEDAVWHLRALEEIPAYLAEHGLQHTWERFSTELGDPATDEQIASFAGACEVPIQPALETTWREIGSARWSFGPIELRFLDPDEVLAFRPKARQLTAQWQNADNPRDPWARIDALVVNQEDDIVLLYTDTERDDARQFATMPEDPGDAWWEKSLGWQFATGLLDAFVTVLKGRSPVLTMLQYGQRWHDGIEYRRFERDSSFWEILADPELARVATRTGKIQTLGRVSFESYGDAAETRAAVDELIDEKLEDGYDELGA